MNNATLPLCVLALFCVQSLTAQDPYFSQFYANRVYLNPAYAGFDPGTTVTLNYRDQWFGLPDGDITTLSDSYRTVNATADVQMPCFLNTRNVDVGMALSLFGDFAGSAPLVTKGAGLAFSVALKMDGRGSMKSPTYRHSLHFGVQTSLMQRSLNWENFIYSSQLDPVTGLIGDRTGLNLTSGIYPSLNAGVFFRGRTNLSRAFKMRYTLGFSVSNVNKPNVALRDAAGEVFLPMRYTIHGGMQLEYRRTQRGNPVFMSPQFRLDSQAGFKLNTYVIGGYLSSEALYAGIFYQDNFPNNPPAPNATGGFITRNTNALILTGGLEIPNTNFMLGLTYDINLSGLRTNNTLGVLEINMRLNILGDGKKGCAVGIPSGCPINNF